VIQEPAIYRKHIVFLNFRMIVWRGFILAAAALLLVASASGAKPKVILDHDGGVDDYLGIY